MPRVIFLWREISELLNITFLQKSVKSFNFKERPKQVRHK